MAVAVPWLPPSREGESEAALSRIVSDWLAEWLVGRVDLQVIAIAAVGPEGVVAEASDRVALGLAACARRADLANPGDATILEAIGGEMITDLTERLGAGVGVKKHRFAVAADDDSWRITLAVDDSLLVGARKAIAGSVRRPVVSPLAEALKNEGVRLGCHLGEAALTAADIAALVVGDMIVLDRALDLPVPLTVEGILPQAGQASIGAEAQAICITVTEPLDLLRKN